jgi:hypothetical protein
MPKRQAVMGVLDAGGSPRDGENAGLALLGVGSSCVPAPVWMGGATAGRFEGSTR